MVPHPQGETETDLTSFVYGQASITLDKWPNFMYLLYPPDEWVEVKREGPVPLAKRDATGRVMYERFKRTDGQKRALLDFRGLPDTVSLSQRSFSPLINMIADLDKGKLVVFCALAAAASAVDLGSDRNEDGAAGGYQI